MPSTGPTHSVAPTMDPTGSPSESHHPSIMPTSGPTLSVEPSLVPSIGPTLSVEPSLDPTGGPSQSHHPSIMPTTGPSQSVGPSESPSLSHQPSTGPSFEPSIAPSFSPSLPGPWLEVLDNGYNVTETITFRYYFDNPGTNPWIGIWPITIDGSPVDGSALPQGSLDWVYVCSSSRSSSCPGGHQDSGIVTIAATFDVIGTVRAFLMEASGPRPPYVSIASTSNFEVSCLPNQYSSTYPHPYGPADPDAYNLWMSIDVSRLDVQTFYGNAHARWSSIIQSDLQQGSRTTVRTRDWDLGFDVCNDNLPDRIDDTFICGLDDCIDGPYNTLGYAGPTQIYTDTGLTAAGRMVFDTEDIPIFLDIWEDVILHEMGHVIGLNSDLFLSSFNSDLQFTGSEAAKVWQVDWECAGFPPIETDGGGGTALSHWDDECLVDELMTGYINTGGNPLSNLSIAALLDKGYSTVDFTQADPYDPPPDCCNPSRRRRNLRGSDVHAMKTEFFQDDGVENFHPMNFEFFQDEQEVGRNVHPTDLALFQEEQDNDGRNVHPLNLNFFSEVNDRDRAQANRGIGDGGGSRRNDKPPRPKKGGRRPPLSKKGLGKAKERGLNLLKKFKLPKGTPRQRNGITYVGDQSINVLVYENGFIYDVDVSADDDDEEEEEGDPR